MQTFSDWVQVRENMLPEVQKRTAIQDAWQGIYNSLANMRSQPSRWLANGLQHALSKVKGIPEAERIIQEMQNLALDFFNRIREFGIYDHGSGGVSTPRMPEKGERGFEQYQQVYTQYYQRLLNVLNGLRNMVN